MIERLRGLVQRRRAVHADPDAERIRREGHVGRAIVLAAEPLRADRDGRVETRLRLDVLLPRHERFTTEIVDRLDAAGRERARVGAVVPVAADLLELGHIVLDLAQIEVNEEAVAALGPIAGGPGGPVRTPPTPPGPADDR